MRICIDLDGVICQLKREGQEYADAPSADPDREPGQGEGHELERPRHQRHQHLRTRQRPGRRRVEEEEDPHGGGHHVRVEGVIPRPTAARIHAGWKAPKPMASATNITTITQR